MSLNCTLTSCSSLFYGDECITTTYENCVSCVDIQSGYFESCSYAYINRTGQYCNRGCNLALYEGNYSSGSCMGQYIPDCFNNCTIFTNTSCGCYGSNYENCGGFSWDDDWNDDLVDTGSFGGLIASCILAFIVLAIVIAIQARLPLSKYKHCIKTFNIVILVFTAILALGAIAWCIYFAAFYAFLPLILFALACSIYVLYKVDLIPTDDEVAHLTSVELSMKSGI